MIPDGLGFHTVIVNGVGVGDRYRIRVDEHRPRPDPASRYQPLGVHGPSEVVSSDFAWKDGDWACPDRRDWIIYELHVGTWTSAGTFRAAIDRLRELVDLGVTAIELMPLADSPGRWNWGYDGVNLFAPNRNYGPPDDLRRLIESAHLNGLAVFLDVVYNHLGPEGNYLAEVGPYLSGRHQTAWGPGPNFDDVTCGRGVRDFILANAIYWLDEFHFDGLRVDAIHCMKDSSRPHIAAELGQAVNQWSIASGRKASLIAETNVHDTLMIQSLDDGGMGYEAQWCDDFLHSVFAVVRPNEQLSERNYIPGSDLEHTLRYGYVYEGSVFEERKRPDLSERDDTCQLIYSLQTHDFVGNHPTGQRLHQITDHETQRACAALLLLMPAIPMLFMGEEFASERPFQFFVDFRDDHLREAVVRGRRNEYPQHDWSTGILPTDPEAFESSKIETLEQGNVSMWEWYRALIRVRKRWISEGLICDRNLSVDCDQAEGIYRVMYQSAHHSATILVRLVDLRETRIRPTPIIFDVPGERVLDSRSDTDANELHPNHAKIFLAQD